MLLSSFRTTVAAELGLDNTAASSDQLLMDQWLNEGVRDILLRTHCTVAPATLALTSGTSDYTLDAAILAIVNASVGTDGRRFEQLGSEELFELRRRNIGATGDSLYYTVLGSNLFLIYPTPTSAATLTFYYVPLPTEMSSGTHDAASATYGGIPVEFHQGIYLYAFMRGASMDDDKSSEMGEKYMKQYELFLGKTIRPALNRMGGSRMPRARVGGRSTLLRDRNDRY